MFNNVNIILVVFLCVTFECNGHLGILSDIVGGAHERIHSTVEKVAGGILGGLNVNFQGHFEAGGHRYPNQPPPPPPQRGQQTVVVVVEEDNEDEHGNGNYGMRPNQYGQGQYNNNYNNNYNHNQNRPGYNQGQWNGNNNANQQRPYGNQNHQHQQPGLWNHNGNYGQPNQYSNQGQNNYEQRPSQANPGNYNNYNNGGNNQRPNQPYQGNHQDQTTHGHNQGSGENNNYGSQTTPKQEETKPTFGSIHEEPTEKPLMEKTTEKDEPLFVPLNPNQYIYGGDKITINAPKREAEKEQKVKDEDEDFPIDIRFQD